MGADVQHARNGARHGRTGCARRHQLFPGGTEKVLGGQNRNLICYHVKDSSKGHGRFVISLLLRPPAGRGQALQHR